MVTNMNSGAQLNLAGNQTSNVTGLDQIPSKLLMPALIVLFYFASLAVGFHKVNYLTDSSLVSLSSNIFGPCAATLSGSIAYIIAFIVPHKYQFATEVFNLSVYNEFRVSLTMAFLLLPITCILAGIINRTFSFYLYRKIIFITIIIITIPILYLTNEFLNNFTEKSAFIFCFAVFGIIYYAVFSCICKDFRSRNSRMRNR